eukprot:287386-Prymnesium_polylepis.1
MPVFRAAGVCRSRAVVPTHGDAGTESPVLTMAKGAPPTAVVERKSSLISMRQSAMDVKFLHKIDRGGKLSLTQREFKLRAEKNEIDFFRCAAPWASLTGT